MGELPIHKFTCDGETQVKPCAGVWLIERTADTILSHGIMPVLSLYERCRAALDARSALKSAYAPGRRLEFEG